MKIIGETVAPLGVTSVGRSRPRTRSHKRPQLVDELEEDETLSSLLMRKKAKVYVFPERPYIEQVSLPQSRPNLPRTSSRLLV